VVLSRHVNLFPGNEVVLRLVPRNALGESECFTADRFRRPLSPSI
jgi:hypothetical protein